MPRRRDSSSEELPVEWVVVHGMTDGAIVLLPAGLTRPLGYFDVSTGEAHVFHNRRHLVFVIRGIDADTPKGPEA